MTAAEIGLWAGVILLAALLDVAIFRRMRRQSKAPRIASPSPSPSPEGKGPSGRKGSGTLESSAVSPFLGGQGSQDLPASPQSPAAVGSAMQGSITTPHSPFLQAGGRGVGASLTRADHLALALFTAAMLLYFGTRLTGLERFPIYFFSDEAIQTLNAADLVRDGLRDHRGTLLPTYFQNGSYYNLSASVYVQVVPYLLFGQSLAATRATSVLLTSLAAVAVSLMLKQVYQAGWWWLGALLLSITPAWLLHSRTAFETGLMVAGYACFLYFYLLYRMRDPRWLYPALVCGALAFYSYTGGQLVVVLTGLGLLLSDLRYHWANRRTGFAGLALLGLLVLPYLRFALDQPGAGLSHLRTLDSYWLRPGLALPDKLAQFWREYQLGLSPAYWFSPDNTRDLPRHIMRGWGHLLPVTLPFLLLGLLACLARVRRPEYRALLIALLAAPAGGAMTSVGITRVLSLVVPAACLTALGIEALRVRWLSLGQTRRQGLRAAAPAAAALGVFALGAVLNLAMLRDGLVNGPLWYRDYGLGGMQYGASQVTGAMRAYLQRRPEAQLRLTPTWANGTDYLVRFFLPNEPRVRLESIDRYLFRRETLSDEHVFVMLAEDFKRASAEPKLLVLGVEQVLPYPDGSDGFLFVRLAYSVQADALFAAERAERQQPQSETLQLDGEAVKIIYSRLDSGRIQDIFDDDTFTLGRTEEANPAVIELVYDRPRPLYGVTVTVGSMDLRLTARLYDGQAEVAVYQQVYTGLPPDPTVHLAFDGQTVAADRLRLEIHSMLESEDAKVHIREIDVAQ